MYIKVRRIIGSIFAIVLLAMVLATMTKVFERKNSINKLGPFFDNASDIDVLFLGTSHVINGVMPMELWDKYGIASYNMAGQDSKIATDYWILMNALDYSTPKVVVVDCYELSEDVKASYFYEYIHLSFDGFPLSYNKIRAAYDLTDDPNFTADYNGEKRVPVGILWDYSVYHSRWKELTEKDFNLDYEKEMGAESRIQIAVPNPINYVERDKKLTEETVSIAYLKKIIEECQSRGIAVVLTYLPFPASENCWIEANTVYDIAKKYGVRYINFLNEDVVDYDVDCYDQYAHLNPAGAKKVTFFLGEILSKEFGFIDHRMDDNYAHWNEMYQAYYVYKCSKLTEQKELDQYLMLLNDDDYEVNIAIGDDRVYQDAIFNKVIDNCNVVDSDLEVVEGQIDIIVRNVKNADVVDVATFYIPEGTDLSKNAIVNDIWIQSYAVRKED